MNIKSSITMLALCLALTSVAQANSTASDQEKLDFIASNFNTNATHSRYWQNGWLTLFSGSALVHAGIWDQTGSQKERFNAKVTVITSTLGARSEEHTSELQSRPHLVCRLLLEKKKKKTK